MIPVDKKVLREQLELLPGMAEDVMHTWQTGDLKDCKEAVKVMRLLLDIVERSMKDDLWRNLT